MNKKYVKLIAIDIALAIIVVVLYSPGLMALRVTDESIFRAGMSILAGLLCEYPDAAGTQTHTYCA